MNAATTVKHNECNKWWYCTCRVNSLSTSNVTLRRKYLRAGPGTKMITLENRLGKVDRHVTSNAKLEGFFTNHSIRASCCTALYNDDSNLPEQFITEGSGHHSLAIKSYKRINNSLKCKVSDVLTEYSAVIGNEDSEQKECKKVLKPIKHSVLKVAHDVEGQNVNNFKVDTSLSFKESVFLWYHCRETITDIYMSRLIYYLICFASDTLKKH